MTEAGGGDVEDLLAGVHAFSSVGGVEGRLGAFGTARLPVWGQLNTA